MSGDQQRVTDRTYGVFAHSTGAAQGGYVVRTIHDGWTPAPYRTEDAERVYQREHAAQAYADLRNKRA